MKPIYGADYLDVMRGTMYALDNMQARIRVETVGTNEELRTLYPLLSLYNQLENVNFRCLEQNIAERSEYETVRNAISERTKRYREWIDMLGGEVK